MNNLHYVEEGVLKGEGAKLHIIFQNALPPCRPKGEARKVDYDGASPLAELREIMDGAQEQAKAARAARKAGNAAGVSGTETNLGSAPLFGEYILFSLR
jgi:hypothetical protein